MRSSPGEPDRSILEHGTQDALQFYLEGRELINQLSPIEEQKETHDEKYRREVAYDARDTAKGKPCFKQYRQDLVNKHSNCDAQYVNNLHFYFGDGSQLHRAPKPHYALDFVNTRGTDSECTTALKSVQVTSNKVTVEWLEDAFRHLKHSHRLRRSFSCPHMKLSDIESEKPLKIFSGQHKFDCPPCVTVFGLGSDFPAEKCNRIDASELHQEIAHGAKVAVQRTNAPYVDRLDFKVSKVLFWTDELIAYVIPTTHVVSEKMEEFSTEFEKWLKRKYHHDRATFGTTKYQQYWKYVNVVLCLPDSEANGVKFRRARHIHYLRNGYDLYLEMDSGKFTAVMSNESTVRRLPQECAKLPIGIVQVSFKGITTTEQMQEQIEIMKRTGRTFVTEIRKCNRPEFQESSAAPWIQQQFMSNWSDLLSVVLCPLRDFEEPLVTRVFCEDRDCMGLCGIHQKRLVPPSS